MRAKVGNAKIDIIRGDITEQAVDVIVNAANPSLMGGGGVDGAIHRKGGPAIREECRRIRETRLQDGLPSGKAVITTGGRLRARYVIHTVAPLWKGGHGGEPVILANCYRSSLDLAKSRGLRTIAFPSLGTGAFGYPISHASNLALSTVKEYLLSKDEFREVVFVLFTNEDLRTYEVAAERLDM